MSDIWKPETFEIAEPSGPRSVAGYTYRGLGLWLLWGPSPKGRRPGRWSLTHLGTGHRLCALDGNVSTAFPVATEIAEAGDWEFLSLEGWKDRFPEAPEKLRAILANHAKIAKRGGGGPLKNGHEIAMQIASNRP